jgi:hypothetical protein
MAWMKWYLTPLIRPDPFNSPILASRGSFADSNQRCSGSHGRFLSLHELCDGNGLQPRYARSVASPAVEKMMSSACLAHWSVICALLFERLESFSPAPSLHELGIDKLPVVDEDARRNERVHYQDVFGGECLSCVGDLFDTTCKKVAAGERQSLLALEIMQGIFARAAWSYGYTLPSRLDEFTREFDRLDVESERARLFDYCKAQYPSGWGIKAGN